MARDHRAETHALTHTHTDALTYYQRGGAWKLSAQHFQLQTAALNRFLDTAELPKEEPTAKEFAAAPSVCDHG